MQNFVPVTTEPREGATVITTISKTVATEKSTLTVRVIGFGAVNFEVKGKHFYMFQVKVELYVTFIGERFIEDSDGVKRLSGNPTTYLPGSIINLAYAGGQMSEEKQLSTIGYYFTFDTIIGEYVNFPVYEVD